MDPFPINNSFSLSDKEKNTRSHNNKRHSSPFSYSGQLYTVAGDESMIIKQMGKYTCQNPSHNGVRTRAKTLALQNAAVSSISYIQLRSRRLIKPTPPKTQKENRLPPKSYRNSTSSSSKILNSGSDKKFGVNEIRDSEDLGIDGEGSFGDNMVEIEGRGRSTRETTPCNLIRDPETISTPGSSTKRTYSTNVNYKCQNSASRHIPSTNEMDEFFTEPEKQQQQLFIEKYNFDPVKDKPLPGRFEWVKMDGTKNVK